jgi:hypothetical protein
LSVTVAISLIFIPSSLLVFKFGSQPHARTTFGSPRPAIAAKRNPIPRVEPMMMAILPVKQ